MDILTKPRDFKAILTILILVVINFNTHGTTTKGLSQLKKELERSERGINQIKAQIKRYEKELSKTNINYITDTTNSNKIKLELERLSKNLIQNNNDLKKLSKRAEQKLARILTTSLTKNEDFTAFANHIVINSLKKELKTIKESTINNQKIKGKLTQIKLSLNEYKTKEKSIIQMINNLEEKKQAALNKYFKAIKLRDKIEARYSSIKSKRTLNIKNNNNKRNKLIPPIKHYISYKHSKKGIYFKYRGVHPVISPADGTISYSGTLSSYGNVIIIDHGKQIRSIILGNFDSKIKKGKKIKTGQILGYTNSPKTSYKSIYLEVRKKRKIQNTILLMDRKLLTNNNL